MIASGNQSRPQLRPQAGKSCYPHQNKEFPLGTPYFIFLFILQKQAQISFCRFIVYTVTLHLLYLHRYPVLPQQFLSEETQEQSLYIRTFSRIHVVAL